MTTTKETGGKYTAIGTNFFQWEPLASQPVTARFLWMALYCSNEARRFPPGLWHGGVPVMAEAAHLETDVVWDALDKLMEAEIVEWDRDRRVARLTTLPDAHERASSWTHLKSWWTRFNLIPPCDVRNGHVKTLRWLVDQGKSPDSMERVWDETFGTIKVLSKGVRGGKRRLADSDTSTAIQPSLFSRSQEPLPSSFSSSASRDARKSPGSTSIEAREHQLRSDSVSKNVNEVNHIIEEGPSHTLSEGVCEGTGEGDPERVRSLSEADPEQGDPPVDRDQRPRLALVPPSGPFSVDDLVAVFGQNHQAMPSELREALYSAIYELRSCGVGHPDLALVGDAIASGGDIPEVPATSGAKRLVGWERAAPLTDSRLLLEIIERARERRARIDEQRRAFAELREKAGL